MLHLAIGALLALPLLWSSASAERTVTAAPPGAGEGPVIEEVNFPISCSPAAQKAFNHAAWTLHSFWYAEALKGVSDIAKAEPDCAIAFWGVAMSHWYPLCVSRRARRLLRLAQTHSRRPTPPVRRPSARRPISRRSLRSIGISTRSTTRTRAIAYERAMEHLYARFPDDQEAGVFYSLALNTTQLPTDRIFANKRKATEILEEVWQAQPNHPGVVHYLIHSDDTQQLAVLGLPAAMCYAKIAPAVPHALHMPSHIFTRLGPGTSATIPPPTPQTPPARS